MEPTEPTPSSGPEYDAQTPSGHFEVLAHSLEVSAIGQSPPQEGMKIVEITTDAGRKLAVSYPKDLDPVPYIKRAIELSETEDRGTILLTGEEE